MFLDDKPGKLLLLRGLLAVSQRSLLYHSLVALHQKSDSKVHTILWFFAAVEFLNNLDTSLRCQLHSLKLILRRGLVLLLRLLGLLEKALIAKDRELVTCEASLHDFLQIGILVWLKFFQLSIVFD